MSSQDHIEIELSNSTIRWYRDKGYDIPTHKVQLWLNKNGKKEKHGTKERIKKGTKIIVKINDLQPESNQRINLFCSNCNEKFSTQFKIYRKRKSDLCTDCAKKRIKGDGSHGYWVNKLITLNPDAKCDISGETDKRFLALHHLDSRKNGGKNTKDNYIILTHNYHFAFHNSLGGTNIPCTKQDYYRFKEKELFKTESQKGNFFNTGNKFQSESKPEVTTRFNDEDKNRVKIRSFTEDLAKLLKAQVNEEIDEETKQLVEEINDELNLTPKEKKIKDFVESIKNNKIFITGMPLRLSNDESPLSRLNVNNLLKKLDQGIFEMLQKVEEEKKAAEAKKEENKLYNNQTLFNTFYCTDPKLYVPTSSEADLGLIDSITRLAAIANSNGYDYVQFNDGSCLKLEEKDSELIIRVAKRK